MVQSLEQRVGVEQDLDDLNRALRDYVRSFAAPGVGALLITCADEAEWECVDSFQRMFAAHLLPKLKFACRAPFRLANLGARYEEGALAVAERHFATPDTHHAFKVMLVKVSAHVAVEGGGATATFGRMQRYGIESIACGALHALLADTHLPVLDELRRTFNADGEDRIRVLADTQQVAPAQRALFAAVASARLQARRVEADIQRHHTHSPTVYVIAACVTLNRTDRDTELLCGLTVADLRTDPPAARHVGLGDHPARYRLHDEFGRLRLTEE